MAFRVWSLKGFKVYILARTFGKRNIGFFKLNNRIYEYNSIFYLYFENPMVSNLNSVDWSLNEDFLLVGFVYSNFLMTINLLGDFNPEKGPVYIILVALN